MHGSDGKKNLKGPAKAAFLVDRFGKENFAYMGDAFADLPVWQVSREIVTVNAPAKLCQQTEQLGKPTEHLKTTEHSLRAHIKALRPHQWLKNILIFLPMLAAHQLDALTLLQSLTALVAFSFVASSVYVLNDLLDLNADRAHPRKRLRPFASGAVPIAHGSLMAIGLLATGVVLSAFLGWLFLLTLGTYYILTTAYSLALKRKTIVDICMLAGLYTMRIIAGGGCHWH